MVNSVLSYWLPHGVILTDLEYDWIVKLAYSLGSMDGQNVFIWFCLMFGSMAPKLYFCCIFSVPVFFFN